MVQEKMAGKAKPVYREYVRSDKWRDKHPHWLEQTGKHCTLLLIPIGQHKRYHPYAMHHLHYGNLGNERLGRDVLPVSEFAHDWVIHGILSGFKRPSQQRHYPNAAQRLAHG